MNTAIAQLNANQLSESLQNVQEVLAVNPSFTEAYYVMSKAYQKLGESAAAIAAAEKATSLFKRGYCLEVKAIELFTTLYDAYVMQPPDHFGGMRSIEQLLSLYPHNLAQLFNYFHIKNYISSLKGLLPLKRRAVEELLSERETIAENARHRVIPPLVPIRASVMVNMDVQTEVNQLFGLYLRSLFKSEYKHAQVRNRKLRDVLRVGLLSADVFYNHPMMHLMRGAFKLIQVGDVKVCERKGCEVILINLSSTRGNVTHIYDELGVRKENVLSELDYQKGRDVFNVKKSYRNSNREFRMINLDLLHADKKAEIINALDLDLLIDLMGYTQGSESSILARRPAVVQVNYLGFPSQISNSFIDFNQQDSIVSPPHFSRYYPDKLVYLPYYYACNHYHKVPDLHPYQSDSANAYLRNSFKVPQDGTLFCFPNQLYKITSDLLDTWANILHRHPFSYLWLLRHPLEGEESIKLELMARGVYKDRVIFSDFEDNKALYMVRTSICDLILDSPIWSAGATGLDAYWSGVPVVNIPGDRTVERLGISLMVEKETPNHT